MSEKLIIERVPINQFQVTVILSAVLKALQFSENNAFSRRMGIFFLCCSTSSAHWEIGRLHIAVKLSSFSFYGYWVNVVLLFLSVALVARRSPDTERERGGEKKRARDRESERSVETS